jgi:hypothetical protein
MYNHKTSLRSAPFYREAFTQNPPVFPIKFTAATKDILNGRIGSTKNQKEKPRFSH